MEKQKISTIIPQEEDDNVFSLFGLFAMFVVGLVFSSAVLLLRVYGWHGAFIIFAPSFVYLIGYILQKGGFLK